MRRRGQVLRPVLLLAAVGAAIFYVSRMKPTAPPAERSADAGEAQLIGPGDVPGRDGATGPAPVEPSTKPPPAARWDAPAPGAAFSLELIAPPRARYGPAEWTEDDRKYAGDLETLDAVEYDPTLGHAARELAVFYSVHHAPAPTQALQFVVNAAGAAEWGVLQSYLTTTDLGDGAVRRRVAELAGRVEDRGEGVRVGVGEAYTIDGPRPQRVVAVLVSGGGLYLDPVARQVAPGASLRLSGTLPRGAVRPALLVAGASGAVLEQPVEADAGEPFSATLRVPGRPGPLWVEIVATLPHGPTPLAQLELSVGAPPPTRFDGHWPPDEAAVNDEPAAEALALALLQADRAGAGLPALTLDPRLTAVARAHSADMRDHGYFGHRSPTTGTVSDRLAKAGYASVGHGENIAGNTSLHDAEAGLFYSLGHRKNLLGPDYTRVGVGVTSRMSHERRQWLVTQVFAQPAPQLAPGEGVDAVYGLVDAGARARGRAALARDRGLERAAEAEAQRLAATPRGALDRAREAGLTERGAFAWTARTPTLARVELPDELYDGAYGRVGVAVVQHPDAPPPNIVVVVLVGG